MQKTGDTKTLGGLVIEYRPYSSSGFYFNYHFRHVNQVDICGNHLTIRDLLYWSASVFLKKLPNFNFI